MEMQIERIFQYYEEPERLLKETLDFLDFYADRTHRPGTATELDDVVSAFHVPGPVLRSLTQAVEIRACGSWEQNESVALALWQAGYRETMLMASSVLRVQSEDAVAQWVESRTGECDDRVVMEHLAKYGLEGWRRRSEAAFLGAVSVWLQGKASQQTLALYALEGAVEDPSFSSLPNVFPMLGGWTSGIRGARRKLYEGLLTSLARRSPKETTHFLLDAIASGERGVKSLARTLVDALPPPQQLLIEHSLSR
jgi:hypothetical protein